MKNTFKFNKVASSIPSFVEKFHILLKIRSSNNIYFNNYNKNEELKYLMYLVTSNLT